MQSRLAPYIALTKPRILLLVVITTVMGYFLGCRFLGTGGVSSYLRLFCTVLGTSLCCAGSSVLNQYLERDVDLRMKRTCRRPLPAGDVSPGNALGFGIVLVLAGTTFLVAEVNLLTGFLALLTVFLYVLVYTPLKRTTWLNTFIGAIPGALPPMGGWAAATGSLDAGAWVLFAIMFLWQHPHFYAIAWMYKEDYRRGGFKMLPVVEPDGRSTFRQVILYSVLLIPASLLPTFIGMSGQVYLAGAVLLGIGFLGAGVVVSRTRTVQDARRLLKASVIYLPLLLGLIVADGRF